MRHRLLLICVATCSNLLLSAQLQYNQQLPTTCKALTSFIHRKHLNYVAPTPQLNYFDAPTSHLTSKPSKAKSKMPLHKYCTRVLLHHGVNSQRLQLQRRIKVSTMACLSASNCDVVPRRDDILLFWSTSRY